MSHNKKQQPSDHIHQKKLDENDLQWDEKDGFGRMRGSEWAEKNGKVSSGSYKLTLANLRIEE